MTAAQGDAVTGLLGAIPGIVGGMFAVLTAFVVFRQVEPLVTPFSNPRDDRAVKLVPDGQPLFDHHGQLWSTGPEHKETPTRTLSMRAGAFWRLGYRRPNCS